MFFIVHVGMEPELYLISRSMSEKNHHLNYLQNVNSGTKYEHSSLSFNPHNNWPHDKSLLLHSSLEHVFSLTNSMNHWYIVLH